MGICGQESKQAFIKVVSPENSRKSIKCIHSPKNNEYIPMGGNQFLDILFPISLVLTFKRAFSQNGSKFFCNSLLCICQKIQCKYWRSHYSFHKSYLFEKQYSLNLQVYLFSSASLVTCISVQHSTKILKKM